MEKVMLISIRSSRAPEPQPWTPRQEPLNERHEIRGRCQPTGEYTRIDAVGYPNRFTEEFRGKEICTRNKKMEERARERLREQKKNNKTSKARQGNANELDAKAEPKLSSVRSWSLYFLFFFKFILACLSLSC